MTYGESTWCELPLCVDKKQTPNGEIFEFNQTINTEFTNEVYIDTYLSTSLTTQNTINGNLSIKTQQTFILEIVSEGSIILN